MNILLESIVFLNSTTGASNRTKNTILEHGNQGFKIVGFDPASQLFGATPAIKVRSVVNATIAGSAFHGWLPLLEIYDK